MVYLNNPQHILLYDSDASSRLYDSDADFFFYIRIYCYDYMRTSYNTFIAYQYIYIITTYHFAEKRKHDLTKSLSADQFVKARLSHDYASIIISYLS
jgi:hypothetical protein